MTTAHKDGLIVARFRISYKTHFYVFRWYGKKRQGLLIKRITQGFTKEMIRTVRRERGEKKFLPE
jgi:hypothetical protein